MKRSEKEKEYEWEEIQKIYFQVEGRERQTVRKRINEEGEWKSWVSIETSTKAKEWEREMVNSGVGDKRKTKGE